MERNKLNHEVGSVYIRNNMSANRLDRRRKVSYNHADNNFDETFMKGVFGSFIGSMIIFGTFFLIVLFI
jgi:hypothetical protein